MKLGKIGALCKSAKRFVIFNVYGEQWMSDGYAMYPLRDLPTLEEENVYTLFDIAEERRGKVQYEEKYSAPYGISLADVVEDEVALQSMPISIIYHGSVLSPIKCREGILFLDKKYLGPFDEDITLFERFYPSGKRPYIAVKRGLLLEGIIIPSDVATPELADMLTNIGELTALMCEDMSEEDYEQEELEV